MTTPEQREPNPTVWVGPILCCAEPVPDRPDGVCGVPIESEPCTEHGTDVPPVPEHRCETCRTSYADCLYERKVTKQRCCGPCLMRDTHGGVDA